MYRKSNLYKIPYPSESSDLVTFSAKIIRWYDAEKRPLPWRSVKDPYKVWLSEIILQQTRVEQGTPYYHKFVEAFPTVADLAAAEEQHVLNLWQGLGYYSRARNLHAAAQFVVSDLNGEFPTNYEQLVQLKGVGDYTASAISSICGGEHQAVVDGNVYRLLARVFGIATPTDTTAGKKEFRSKAQELIDGTMRPGDHNQAMMELGSMICTPKDPSCDACVLMDQCEAKARGVIAELPVKSRKVKIRLRYFNYLVIRDQDGFLLNKRSDKDIWASMFDFPLIESDDALLTKEQLANHPSLKDVIGNEKVNVVDHTDRRHVLSHQRIHARFFRVEASDGGVDNKLLVNDIKDYPIPKLIENYLKDTGH